MDRKMSIRYSNCMKWIKNPDWYIYDKEEKRYYLKADVPQEIKDGFEIYKKINHLKYDSYIN